MTQPQGQHKAGPRRTVPRAEGWRDGWTDRWVDRQMGGQTEGRQTACRPVGGHGQTGMAVARWPGAVLGVEAGAWVDCRGGAMAGGQLRAR